jgi:hypothetical protein
MILLECCDENELEEKEQFYINKFKSEYFGFNQLNSISLYPKYNKARKKRDVTLQYLDAVKTNAILLRRYWGYGFTVFNYEYGFYRSPISSIDAKGADLQLILREVNDAIIELSRLADSDFSSKSREITQAEKEVYDQINEIEALLLPINVKIDKQKKLIRTKFKEICDYSPTRYEFEHFIEGFYDDDQRKMFNAAMKKKNLHFRFYSRLKYEFEILDNLYDEREDILSDVEEGKSQKREIINQLYVKRKELKADLRLGCLLPSVCFSPFVLKDCRRMQKIDENSIFFVVSNNGRISAPEIIAIYSNINGILKNYYINNQTTKQNVDYIEKYAYFRRSSFFGKREVYKIIPRNSSICFNGLICDNHISVLSEYKTGINEYSFVGIELIELKAVIEELLLQLKDTDKVKFICSESNNILYSILEKTLDEQIHKELMKFILTKK